MGDPAAWGAPPQNAPWNAPPAAVAAPPYAPSPAGPNAHPGAVPNAQPGAFPQVPWELLKSESLFPPVGPDGWAGMVPWRMEVEEVSPSEDPQAVAMAQALLEEKLAMVARTEGPGEFWGFVNTPRGRAIARKFYIAGEEGLQVTLTNYGARVISIRMPDSYGDVDEVVMGLDNLSDYELVKQHRLGCVLGRMTCPIIGPPQEKGHTNFDEMAWEAHLKNPSHVVFSLHSPAGEQDYPGDLLVTVEYSLEPGNQLLLRMSASCTMATPLSMSARLPFNLAGQRSGFIGLCDHHLMINARKFLEADKDGMLTGEIRHSKNHGLLFLAPILMTNAFRRGRLGGFDHHLLLNGNPSDGLRFIARLSHRSSGRTVEIYSNTRCLHLDTLSTLSVPAPEGEEIEDEEEIEVYGAPPPSPPPPPPPPPPLSEQIEGRQRGEGITEGGPDDNLEQLGEYDYTETWGEDMTATTNEAGEDDGDTTELPVEEVLTIRLLQDLSPHGAIILAPEDYPDTIFEKQKTFILEPGRPYERVVRFNFASLPPPKPPASAVRPGAGDAEKPTGAGNAPLTPFTPATRGSMAAGDTRRIA